jgi:hypothetical protein
VAARNSSNQLRSVQLPTVVKTSATTAIQTATAYQRRRKGIERKNLNMHHCDWLVTLRLSHVAHLAATCAAFTPRRLRVPMCAAVATARTFVTAKRAKSCLKSHMASVTLLLWLLPADTQV